MALKRHWLKIFILFAIGLYAMRTFWGPYFYDGHDSQAHIVRLQQFDKAIKSGQIPPRWAPDLYAGRGYPVFIFAYPLPYFIAEGLHFSGFSLAVSLKLTFVLAYLASLLGMYFLAGFTGAILWGIAPYMFVKILITGSLGVVVAFAFIPWFFFAVKQKRWPAAGILLALWIMSHPGKLVIFSPALILFFLKDTKHWRQWLIVGLLALGLSSWYFLPANLELPYTHFKEYVQNNYQNDFVPFSRLLYSKWGTNAPGWGANPLSQQVGIAQWLAVVLGLIFWRRLWPYLSVFALSIFLMLKQSQFIWDLPTPLRDVGTPWRFLSLAIFSSALIGSQAIRLIKPHILKIVAAGLLVGLALYGNRNHMRINDTRVYDQSFFDNYTGVATGWNEHLPIWVKDVDYDKPGQRLEVINGDCEIDALKINCRGESNLKLNTLYYPGWHLYIDGQETAIEPTDNGLIGFTAPAGEHVITTSFNDTPLRKVSKMITVASIIIFITLWTKKSI